MSSRKTPWFVLHAPELGQKFQDFYQQCIEDGVLDKKTKELLLLSLASVFRCPHCTEKHLKGATEASATKAEITEVLLITAVEAADTQLAWAKQLYCKYLGDDSTK